MFDSLSEKLEKVFKNLRGQGKLTEDNVRESVKEVRRALLEADVNFKVVKEFIGAVEAKAYGQETLRSISPGEQVVKIIHDELVTVLGGENAPIAFRATPGKLVVCGLQGSGKTTLCGKLALHYQKKGQRPLLVAGDVYRPAAVKQLQVLGKSIDVPVFHIDKKPPQICEEALEYARANNLTLVIFDTAGRLHIDLELMEELKEIKRRVTPDEIILVADSMTGQDAVNVAQQFNEALDITGVALTKLDGDARGGAALSIRHVTGKPLKLVSIGEKLSDLELFYPERMASRILGMGDIVSLVEKAQETIDLKEAEKLEKKLRKDQFTFDDFYQQLQQLKKMGSLESILKMIPGVSSAMRNVDIDESQMKRVEAIILSMTPEERNRPQILNGSRRARIADGSGNSIQEVNRLIKQFQQMQKMLKQMRGGKLKRMIPGNFFN
ncbi:MAG: signal recognition particle protein [candidate division Zixibacteria bacterium]|nr:signal recognition particle protein [candidate division Zixibacteria bacterium]